MPLDTKTLPRQGSAPLSPVAEDAPDVDRYFVFYRNAKNERGNYELDETRSVDRAAIVRDVAHGQFEDIDFILCGNEAMPFFRNVTRDVADDVLTFCVEDERTLSPELLDWLQKHVGIRLMQDAIAEYPYLQPGFGGR